MEPRIEVSFTPTISQHLSLNVRVLLRRTRGLVLVGAVQVVVYICAILFYPSPYVFRWGTQAFLLSIPIIVFVFSPIFLYLAVWHQWIRGIDIREPRIYQFSDRGFVVEGETFVTSTSWEQVTTVERLGRLIVLTTAEDRCHLIPLEAFSDQVQWDGLQNLVRSKVGDRKLPKAAS